MCRSKRKTSMWVVVVEKARILYVTDYKDPDGTQGLDYDMKYAKIFQTRNGAVARVNRLRREEAIEANVYEVNLTLGVKVK